MKRDLAWLIALILFIPVCIWPKRLIPESPSPQKANIGNSMAMYAPDERTHAHLYSNDPPSSMRTARGTHFTVMPTLPLLSNDELHAIDIKVGDGAAARDGNTIVVEYTGWLQNGKEFDSSFHRGAIPFSFVLGQHRVIPGWEKGLDGMRIGGVRELVIPPTLAYGARGAPPIIPPNATLIYEVQLLGAN